MLYMGVTVALLVIAVSVQSRMHASRSPQTDQANQEVGKSPDESGPVLYKLASAGKEQEVRALLDMAVPDCVRFIDPVSGASALWIASAKGHLGVVRALLEVSADVTQSNRNGATCLLVASQQGELDVVRTLLDTDGVLTLDRRNANGATPLSVASQEGKLDVVKALLRASASIDLPMSDGATPLFMASGLGQLEVVKALLKGSANVDALTNEAVTPLFMASGNGRVEVVRVLLAAGANRSIPWTAPSGMQYTPLSKADQKGHSTVAALLRADPNDFHRAASF